MDLSRRLALLLVLAACGSHAHGNTDAGVDGGYVADACEGLRCFQAGDLCAQKGLPPTTLSGTVYAPNGTLPLYGVDVYVPETDPGPLMAGAICARCDQGLQGGAIVSTKTDEYGRFKLENVPATASVPLVIQTGKWRRQLTIANVAACEDQPLAATETRLPKNHMEGDLPKIAISTGGADAFECLPLKLGIDPIEFTNPTGTGHIHMYTNPVGGPDAGGSPAGQGANKFATTNWTGGTGNFGASQTLWANVDNMKPYDIVILSCEGDQYPGSKGTTGLAALKSYADLGGRVFLSHWQNVWLEGATGATAPPEWGVGAGIGGPVATWNNSGTSFTSPPYAGGTSLPDIIDEVANPKGASFATWMMGPEVMGSTIRGQIPIKDGKQTCTGVGMGTEQWTTWTNQVVPPATFPQNFQFTTPRELSSDQRCGKVVFSDMHVSSTASSDPLTPFPGGCNLATPLSQQEKALAFMFFDIASCVGSIF
ncbi:MAG TPA: hypothetical protein VMZ53_10590 [Kofleriaceae bacterium]|nr:hypothetical protein [Kofleriaceae bacterium]